MSEQQHVKDKFWNFVFYKFIFIFGVMNVQHMDEVMVWSAWFSMLGFLHLLSQLCKDRFEYVSTVCSTLHSRVCIVLENPPIFFFQILMDDGLEKHRFSRIYARKYDLLPLKYAIIYLVKY